MSYPSGTLGFMDIVIRQAEPGEYETIGEITAQAYLQDGFLTFGGEDDWYFAELKDVAKRAADAEVLVAVHQDRILGGVTYVPDPGPMSDLAGPAEAEIRMLAVSHAARGRGAGEALVRACVDRARRAGRTRVVLCTQPAMTAAHRLYERQGFARRPDRDWQPIPGHDFTLLAYELTL
ncbi:putative N-acetyltransferase YhbS [Streptomyces sp. VMFN-G11Ma]|nr:putative N-acetyltransferase YhbS [Streptomyces sp. VMFN-G11Ma]